MPASKRRYGRLSGAPAQRARALMMLEHKIRTGDSLEATAKAFGVSKKTVERALTLARKAELIVEAEDRILQNLVPAAETALAAALASAENPIKAGELGLKLLEGLLPSLKKKQGPASGGGPVDELESYIANLRGQLANTVEGQIVVASTPAEASDAAPRLPEPNLSLNAGESDAAERPQDVGEELGERTVDNSGD